LCEVRKPKQQKKENDTLVKRKPVAELGTLIANPRQPKGRRRKTWIPDTRQSTQNTFRNDEGWRGPRVHTMQKLLERNQIKLTREKNEGPRGNRKNPEEKRRLLNPGGER